MRRESLCGTPARSCKWCAEMASWYRFARHPFSPSFFFVLCGCQASKRSMVCCGRNSKMHSSWCGCACGGAAAVLPLRGRFRFYYLDANFTAGGGARPPKGREAYLFSVDPATGGTTKQTISGAVDFTTGYAFYPEDGTILLATDAGDRPLPTPPPVGTNMMCTEAMMCYPSRWHPLSIVLTCAPHFSHF